MPDTSYLDLPLRTFLRLLADDQPAPPSGGGRGGARGRAGRQPVRDDGAAVGLEQVLEAAELAAEAGRLTDLVAPLAQADAEAYRAVIAARRRPTAAQAEPGAALAVALSDAADVPLRVAEIGAQVAALATRLAARGNPNLHGDAVTAALLAEAGTRSACALVRLNLSGAESG